jgi:hypothetical protein
MYSAKGTDRQNMSYFFNGNCMFAFSWFITMVEERNGFIFLCVCMVMTFHCMFLYYSCLFVIPG